MRSLRDAIIRDVSGPSESTNIGLWLDRYFDASSEGEAAGLKQEHLKKVLKIGVPQGYRAFLAQRRELLVLAPDTVLIKAETVGRLAIGLGENSVWENNVDLQHTWGLPIIPGSALKGLAAAFAHQYLASEEWQRDHLDQENREKIGGYSHHMLFGTTESQGLVTFHDALWLPPQADNTNGLVLDTITVHHQDYYQENSTVPPADWDSPVPVPFLAVTGSFEFALSGPPDWVDAAYKILDQALKQIGAGAKTSSGYGRMEIEQILSEEEIRIKELKHSIKHFLFSHQPGEMGKVGHLIKMIWEGATSEDECKELCSQLYRRVLDQDKRTRKVVKSYLKDKLFSKDKEKKSFMDVIWKDILDASVFGKDGGAQKDGELQNKQQFSSEQLLEKAEVLLEGILDELPGEKDLEALLLEKVPQIFEEKLNKDLRNQFGHEVRAFAESTGSFSGKELKLIQDSSKKAVKKFFK